MSITTLSLSLVRTHPNQWRIQDFPEVGASTYNFVKFSQELHEIERIWPQEGGGGSKSLLCRSATANVSIHLEALVILISTSRDIISTTLKKCTYFFYFYPPRKVFFHTVRRPHYIRWCRTVAWNRFWNVRVFENSISSNIAMCRDKDHLC